MYNAPVPIRSYEIRICSSCGLRYPLVEAHPFGIRCPVCLGETRVAFSRPLHGDFRGSREEGQEKQNIAVLLDNIRSAWNVGSILRSADGFGFSHAYLCGITPTPENEDIAKTALGAEESVSWSYHKDAVELVKRLKVEGQRVYGLEEDARAVILGRLKKLTDGSQGEVLIVGNEVTGVDPELLDLCDRIVSIPMRGEKRSFNVAIAFGIAAYALYAQKA